MDVLSEVLRVIKLDGALFFNAEFSAPWCVSESRANSSESPNPAGAGHLINYHFLTHGRAYAKLLDGPREELVAGDIVVFPHGDAHIIGNGAPELPVAASEAFDKESTQKLGLVRYGGGGEVTTFVCGYFSCDPRLSELLLAGLPRMLKVPVSKSPSGEWLENSIRFSVRQAGDSAAGGGLILSKLSEVLFLETLRCYINSLPPEHIGWLAGARDPAIGQALTLMHREPASPWTISTLAKRVGLSRSRLAEHFRHFLGESPMSYLAKWRLTLGAELLQQSRDSVAEVAAAVGYGSEAAFNRAFKREFDCPPAQFRRRRAAEA